MSRRFRTRLAGVAIVSACGFTASTTGDGGTGGTPDDSRIIDSPPDVYIAPECLAAGKTCVGNGERLRACTAVGATPVDTICAWRCTDTPMPHCRALQPAGGAVTAADLEPTIGLADKSIAATVTTVEFDTSTGSIVTDGVITVRPGTPGLVNGIDFSVRSGVGVWRFNKLALSGIDIRFTGPNAAALVAVTEIQINGKIDLQGDCQGRAAGPGGGSGGNESEPGGGIGGGGSGAGDDVDCDGGGGGGHAAAGGSGGGGRPGGTEFGTAMIPALTGGGGGGGGGGDGSGANGGGGGGAIQIVANFKVRIDGNFTTVGGIQAGGCNGKTDAACGGGAGAGGTILIEAAVIEVINATFAVNGGGGGGGKSGSSGERALFSTQRANGGNGGTSGSGADGGDGGDGGDDQAFPGLPGESAARSGGGGGAVGRMRFNTLTGTIMKQGVIFSPPLPSAPVSEGPASLL